MLERTRGLPVPLRLQCQCLRKPSNVRLLQTKVHIPRRPRPSPHYEPRAKGPRPTPVPVRWFKDIDGGPRWRNLVIFGR